MKGIILLLSVLILGVLIVGCVSNDSLVGEARRMPSKGIESIYGERLVVELGKQNDGEYKIIRAYKQKYNKKQDEFFREAVPQEYLGDQELFIRQGKTTISQRYNSESAFIAENFDGDGKIELIEYKEEFVENPLIRIPLDRTGNKINLESSLEMWRKDINTGKEQILITKKDFFKWKQIILTSEIDMGQTLKSIGQASLIPKSRNLVTGRATDGGPQEVCGDLKEIVPGHNDATDVNRINMVFIGSGYPNKELFLDILPYFLDLDKKGLVYNYKYHQYYDYDKKEFIHLAEEEVPDEEKDEIEWKERTEEYHGMFFHAPFEGNQNLFNFWFVDDNLEPYKLQSGSGSLCSCFNSEKYICDVDLPNKKVNILCNDNCVSYSGFYATLSQTATGYFPDNIDYYNLGFDRYSPHVFLHEWGHQFGGLRDEYAEGSQEDNPGYPNCAPSKDIGAKWWQKIFPNLQFFDCCSHRCDGNTRFNDLSFMNAPAFWTLFYGEINEFHMCKVMFDIVGEVGGSCKKFFKENCQDDEDNDFDNFIDCADSDCKLKPACITGETDCNDNKDNDGDGQIDCADYDCGGCNEVNKATFNSEVEGSGDICTYEFDKNTKEPTTKSCEADILYDPNYCFDNKDNDGDGLTDCSDPDCKDEVTTDGEKCKFAYDSHEIAICGGTQQIGCFDDSNIPSNWFSSNKKKYFCEIYGKEDAVSQTITASTYEKAALDCCIYLSNFLDKGYYGTAEYKKQFFPSDFTTPIKFYECTSIEVCYNDIDDDGDGLVDWEDVDDCVITTDVLKKVGKRI